MTTRVLLDAVAFCLVVAVVGYLLGYWLRSRHRTAYVIRGANGERESGTGRFDRRAGTLVDRRPRAFCPDCRGTGHSGHLHDELCPTCAGGRWQA